MLCVKKKKKKGKGVCTRNPACNWVAVRVHSYKLKGVPVMFVTGQGLWKIRSLWRVTVVSFVERRMYIRLLNSTA